MMCVCDRVHPCHDWHVEVREQPGFVLFFHHVQPERETEPTLQPLPLPFSPLRLSPFSCLSA